MNRDDTTLDREFRRERMRFLCEANALSIGLGYGDLRRLNPSGDSAAVRGLDDVATIMANRYPGILGRDDMAYQDRLFDMLVSERWQWWMNWTTAKLSRNARKAWRTRRVS